MSDHLSARADETSSGPRDAKEPEAARVSGRLLGTTADGITMKVREGANRILKVTAATGITLDGKMAALKDLREGDRLEATIIEGDIARTIAATRDGKVEIVSVLRQQEGVPESSPKDSRPEKQDRADDATNADGKKDASPPKKERGEGGRRRRDLNDGGMPRALLGITLGESDRRDGASVRGVFPRGPAAKAGLRPGDVIVTLNGESVARVRDVIDAIRDAEPEQELEIVVERNGEKDTFKATLADRARFFEETDHDWRGFRNDFDEEGSEFEMLLEHNRRLAEQQERLERRLDEVLEELRALRKELGERKVRPDAPPAEL